MQSEIKLSVREVSSCDGGPISSQKRLAARNTPEFSRREPSFRSFGSRTWMEVVFVLKHLISELCLSCMRSVITE